MTYHKLIRSYRRKRWKKYLGLIDGFKKPNDYRKIQKYEKRKKRRASKKEKNIVSHNQSKRFKLNRNLIDLPAKIDFFKNENVFLDFAQNLERIKKTPLKHFIINHKNLSYISIDGLLWLVSFLDYLSHSRKNERPDQVLKFTYNEKFGVRKEYSKLRFLLLESGYWEYWGISKPYQIEKNIENEYFLSIKSDHVYSGKCVTDVRDFINSEVNFLQTEEIQNYFDDAISEAMANTLEHAYIQSMPFKTTGKWWLCGHYDKKDNTLEFAFRDYGVGLRKTIEYNSDGGIQSFIRQKKADFFQTDSDIIKMLVNDQLPKYQGKQNRKRGYGFKKFKEFALNCGHDCEMIIVSGKGKYHFTDINNQQSEVAHDMHMSVDGFLICWKLKLMGGGQNG